MILLLCVLCFAALACSGTAFFPTKTVYVVDVAADQDWQETAISLEAGQQVRVQYLAGQWTDWLGTVPLFGPAGETYVCPYGNCCEPLAEERKGALIGRVGDAIFLIGAAHSFTAPAGGMLYLRMNDCFSALQDNVGFLRIMLVP
jgi:hypothetical protein